MTKNWFYSDLNPGLQLLRSFALGYYLSPLRGFETGQRPV